MTDRATTASYVASGATATWGLFTAQEWGVIIGGLVALITGAVSVWAKLREDRRQARLAEAKLEALRRE